MTSRPTGRENQFAAVPSGALPAPPPYDDPLGRSRVARIVAEHGTVLLLDLLLGQARRDQTDPLGITTEIGRWQPFTSVGLITVGLPGAIRLPKNQVLLIPPVESIEWTGPQSHLPSRDIDAMRIIGSFITWRRRAWWDPRRSSLRR
jgi:hypothetical protein